MGCFIYILDIVKIQVYLHFDLVSSVLALEATEAVSELVTQMALESSHFSTTKEISIKATFFFM